MHTSRKLSRLDALMVSKDRKFRLRRLGTVAIAMGIIFPLQASPLTHTVRSGERLADIARRYKVAVKAIIEKNRLENPDLIRPGQKLAIPKAGENSDAPDPEARKDVKEAGSQVTPVSMRPLPPVGPPVLLPPAPSEREPGLSGKTDQVQVEIVALEKLSAPSRERATGVFARRSLTVGESIILDFSGLTRIAIGNPAVADVVVLSTNQLLVNGKGPGKTELYIWDLRGRSTYHLVVKTAVDMADVVGRIEKDLENPEIRVRAVGDTILLEGTVPSQGDSQKAEAIASAHHKTVKNLIEVQPPAPPTPPPAPPMAEAEAPRLQQAIASDKITVRPLTDTVVAVEGTVTTQETERARKIIGAWGKEVQILDLLQTAPAVKKQLITRVRVVDINKTKLKNLGVDWGRVVETQQDGDQQRRVTIQDQPFLFGQADTGPFSIFRGGPIRRFDPIGARIQALIQENNARVLSEPNLMVMDGEKASMLVGGSIPIPVVQATGGGSAVTVQYQEYGVQLEVEPQIQEDGMIRLKITPEVSTLDYANAVVLQGFSVPALRTRRASTVLHIGDGQTLVIGGLLQNDIAKVVKAIPLLSKIPVLGELFKSQSFTRGESELVILVTPEILKTEGQE